MTTLSSFSPFSSYDASEAFDAGRGVDGSNVFEPEIVLPGQLEALRTRRPEGARALMLAVLEEAIACLQGDGRCLRSESSREAARARRWVRDRDRNWLFSFENICAALEIDADALRSSLLRITANDLPRTRASLTHRVSRGANRRVVATTRRVRRTAATR